MKVYKKDLNEFIVKVKYKAIESVKSEFDKQISDIQEEKFLDIKNEILEIDRLLVKAHELSMKIKEKQEYYSSGYYLERELRQTLTTCRYVRKSEMIKGKIEEKLISERNLKVNEVGLEYTKVMQFIKQNTTKKGYEYLKELGFDVTSIPTYENNASNNKTLAVNIDTNKLFVCGDNK